MNDLDSSISTRSDYPTVTNFFMEEKIYFWELRELHQLLSGVDDWLYECHILSIESLIHIWDPITYITLHLGVEESLLDDL